MKRFITITLLTVCLTSVAVAGDIPGSGPSAPPPCTENCLMAEPELPVISITEFVSDILALVF